jgi:hypothetical protein
MNADKNPGKVDGKLQPLAWLRRRKWRRLTGAPTPWILLLVRLNFLSVVNPLVHELRENEARQGAEGCEPEHSFFCR